MITTNFETFSQRSKEMAWANRPTSHPSGATGRRQNHEPHILYSLSARPEPVAGPRSWHCGNGGKWGEEKLRKSSKVARVTMRDEALNENYALVGISQTSSKHKKMFDHFKDHASQGDIMYLHCSWKLTDNDTITDCTDKAVTHYGIYTGESPRNITRLDCQETCDEVGDIGGNQWAIPVERWIPIPDGPFKGGGDGWRKGTLYEVTNNPDYN
jgi:hypothetical protein|tara:strand:+ start:1057 stop:1695 length:639 start_codon:yes stop_codon:yes gene_type:complete